VDADRGVYLWYLGLKWLSDLGRGTAWKGFGCFPYGTGCIAGFSTVVWCLCIVGWGMGFGGG
jgi:hypothetical protein